MSAFSDIPTDSDSGELGGEPFDPSALEPDFDEDFSGDGDLDGGGDAPVPTRYPTVDAWVNGWLLVVYRRSVRGRGLTWCPEWWQHPEAKLRLTALWQTWEAMRLEPPFGMADWLRVHCDHHLPILLSPDGPFKGCEPGSHSEHAAGRLPTTPDQTTADENEPLHEAYLDHSDRVAG